MTMSDTKYWISPCGDRSFAVWKKNELGMVIRIGIYRSYKKAEAVKNSLTNPIPHSVP